MLTFENRCTINRDVTPVYFWGRGGRGVTEVCPAKILSVTFILVTVVDQMVLCLN